MATTHGVNLSQCLGGARQQRSDRAGHGETCTPCLASQEDLSLVRHLAKQVRDGGGGTSGLCHDECGLGVYDSSFLFGQKIVLLQKLLAGQTGNTQDVQGIVFMVLVGTSAGVGSSRLVEPIQDRKASSRGFFGFLGAVIFQDAVVSFVQELQVLIGGTRLFSAAKDRVPPLLRVGAAAAAATVGINDNVAAGAIGNVIQLILLRRASAVGGSDSCAASST